jgi:hypothetical protein
VLTDKPPNSIYAYRMVRRRTAEAGFKIKLGCQVFCATSSTAYLEVGGTLENAQAMAAHESLRTTKLYDRTGDEITLDEGRSNYENKYRGDECKGPANAWLRMRASATAKADGACVPAISGGTGALLIYCFPMGAADEPVICR